MINVKGNIMDEEKLNEIWIALNDLETMFHEMNAVFDVLEVYGDKFDKKNYIEGVFFLTSNLYNRFKSISFKYQKTQDDVFKLIKNLK